MEAYTRDTKHVVQFFESLRDICACILATADVGLLYTIIGHDEAVKAIRWALSSSDLPASHQMFILKPLKFCLKHNYFGIGIIIIYRLRG